MDQQGKFTRNYTRTFLVHSDSFTEISITVLNDSRIPKLGSSYAEDIISRVTKITPTRDKDNPLHWTVEVQYTQFPLATDKPQSNPNDPLSPQYYLPEITTSWVKHQYPIYVDWLGNPIVNSAGNFFTDPPVLVDDDILQVHLTKYEVTHDIPQAIAYKNSVNSDTWWGCPPWTLKLLPVVTKNELRSDGVWWVKTYTVEINPMGWGGRPIDKGFNKSCKFNSDGRIVSPSTGDDASTMKIVPITDASGMPTKQSVFLDGHGQPLANGAQPVWVAFDKAFPPPNIGGNPMPKGYAKYKPMPFANLKDAYGKPALYPDLMDLGGRGGGWGMLGQFGIVNAAGEATTSPGSNNYVPGDG
jgi:hypothetical protein